MSSKSQLDGRFAVWALITLGSLAPVVPPVAGQASESSLPRGSARGFIGSLGIGGGPLGLAGQISLGAATPVGDVFARTAGASNVEPVAMFGRRGVLDSSSDVALLFGRRLTVGSRAWLRMAAGPAVARTVGHWGFEGCDHPDTCTWEEGESSALGLATQLDGAWRRLGLGVFANLNGDRSFWGATLGVHFGAGR